MIQVAKVQLRSRLAAECFQQIRQRILAQCVPSRVSVTLRTLSRLDGGETFANNIDADNGLFPRPLASASAVQHQCATSVGKLNMVPRLCT